LIWRKWESFIAFDATIELLKDRNMTHIIEDVYKNVLNKLIYQKNILKTMFKKFMLLLRMKKFLLKSVNYLLHLQLTLRLKSSTKQ